MGLIVYSCPYVPTEMIAAYGLTPSRILPVSDTLSEPVGIMAGVCPYMRSFINSACALNDVKAIVLTTICDQMRRAKDYLDRQTDIPSFMLNVPSMWQTTEAVQLYVAEIRRFGQFLEKMGGKFPRADVLWKVMESYDSKREKLRSLKGGGSAVEYSKAIAEFNKSGEIVDLRPQMTFRTKGLPLALIGGPMTIRGFELFEIVEKAGGTIILDGTETGERTMPAPFNRRHSAADDPIEELAGYYFGYIPDVFRRPNSELYRWLGRELESLGVFGVILIRHTWCDKWHAEVCRLKEWLKVPLLDMELDGTSLTARNAGRIQAFIETLS